MSTHTTTATVGFRQRIGSAISGVLIAPVLLLLAGGALFTNEGRAVKRAKSLKEGRGSVVSASSLQSANEGRLVHVSGVADSGETLRDSALQVSARAIALTRSVEMYQWRETSSTKTEKKLGGGERKITTYSYETEWSPRSINSSSFEVPAGHQNPGSFPIESETVRAERVTLGDFELGDAMVAKIGGSTPVQPPADFPRQLGDWPTHVKDGLVYVRGDGSRPKVGDLRLQWTAVLPGEVSVVGAQTGSTLGPYKTSNGGNVALLQRGTVAADAMFDTAVASNRALTWGLRFLGFLMALAAIRSVFYPVRVFADIVPFFGRIAGVGINVVSLLSAGIFSLTIIMVAWIFFRPLLGILLLGGVIVLAVLLVRQISSSRREEAAAPVRAGLPPLPQSS